MSKILIKNGRVIDPETHFDQIADVLVVDDTIQAIGQIETDPDARVVDATDKIVMPGVIDLHVHLRDMEQAYKETIESGTKAARAGGVTTVLTMPNTLPPLCNTDNIRKYQALLKDARIEVHLVGAITKDLKGKELADIDAYPALGIQFISDDGWDIDDETLYKEAFLKAKEHDLAILPHPEMADIGVGGVVNEGKISDQLGVPGQPNAKEYKAVERAIRLARETGGRVHLTHLSTKESVDLVRQAKKETDLVTCDATPHHFSLTEDECLQSGTLAKVNPPLRREEDRQAVLEAIKDGTVDFIITDHAPHSEEEKGEDFTKAAFGISQIETSLASTLTELYFKQGMELIRVIDLMTYQPAEFAKLRQGRLQEGYPADITIVDLNEERVFDRNTMISKGKNTPFHGKTLKGWPVATIVKGALYEIN
jgi:dihydroorotase